MRGHQAFAVGIVSMIMIFVIRKFEQIFQRLRTKLPPITHPASTFSAWFAKTTGGHSQSSRPFVFMLTIKLIRHERRRASSAVDVVKLKIRMGGFFPRTAIARFTERRHVISAGVPTSTPSKHHQETCATKFQPALAKVHDANPPKGESMADRSAATKVCDISS